MVCAVWEIYCGLQPSSCVHPTVGKQRAVNFQIANVAICRPCHQQRLQCHLQNLHQPVLLADQVRRLWYEIIRCFYKKVYFILKSFYYWHFKYTFFPIYFFLWQMLIFSFIFAIKIYHAKTVVLVSNLNPNVSIFWFKVYDIIYQQNCNFLLPPALFLHYSKNLLA